VAHGGQQIRFTISLGIALLEEDCQRYEQLIERADAALYDSKESGRNRTSIHDKS